MRLLRGLLVSGSAALAAGAMAITAGSTTTIATASGRAPRPASHGPSARFLAEARASLVSYLRHNHPQAWLTRTPSTHAGVRGTTKTSSFNWSGYADASNTSGAFTKVSGSWVTPKVKCGAEDQLTSEWVGIDGFNTGTVEQDGTLDWCYRGRATYFTWYEMFPAGTIAVGNSLKPGDKISASVTRTGTTYKLSVTDSTNKRNSFTKTATCPATTCLNQSAEWIAERPAFQIGIAPLANYSSWKLTNGKETANGHAGTIGSFAANFLINMADATQAYNLSTSSKLTGGNSFSTTWKNSY